MHIKFRKLLRIIKTHLSYKKRLPKRTIKRESSQLEAGLNYSVLKFFLYAERVGLFLLPEGRDFLMRDGEY